MTILFRTAWAAVTLLTVASASLAASPSVAPAPNTITLTGRDRGKSITVRRGATLVVRLPDPRGGRHWDYLWAEGNDFLRPLPQTPGPGGANTLRFVVTAGNMSDGHLYCLAPGPGSNWLHGARFWWATLACPSAPPARSPSRSLPAPPKRPAGGVVEITEGDEGAPIRVRPRAVVTVDLTNPGDGGFFSLFYLWDPRDTFLWPLPDAESIRARPAPAPAGPVRNGGGNPGDWGRIDFSFATGAAVHGRIERLRFVSRRHDDYDLSETHPEEFILHGR